jgi:phosphate transport system permease protein
MSSVVHLPDTAAAGRGPDVVTATPPSRLPVPAPRRAGRTGRDELGLLAACAISALALIWIIFAQLTPASGIAGSVICWYAAFLGLYWVTSIELAGRAVANDRVVSVLVSTAMVGVLAAVVATLVFVVIKGAPLLSVHLLTHDEKGIGPLSPPGSGGVLHAVVGTLEQVGIAVAFAAPAGVATAIFLNEVGGRFTRAVRVVVTAMAGVPTIVAGIFIYSLWIVALGQGFSGFAGSLALFIVILPSITRTTEEVLKTVDDSLREAATALGAPAWRTTWKVVLPAAKSGVVTSILLGTARAVGETAPLLVTIFGSTITNANPFHGAQEALPLDAYENVKLPLASQIQLGFASALVLVLLVLILFVLARLIGRKKQ